MAKVKAELGSGESALCGNRKISQLFPTDSAVQMKACPRLKIKGTNWLATEWRQAKVFHAIKEEILVMRRRAEKLERQKFDNH